MDSHRTSALARALPECLYLLERLPREKWVGETIHGTAGFWLAQHQGLRAGQARLLALGEDWQAGRRDTASYQAGALPLLHEYRAHLDGHHGVEDRHYFPAMRRAAPRLRRGFDLLDGDHEHIEQQIRRIQDLLADLRQRPDNATDVALAARLDDALRDGSRWLYLHLMDEEDLVIPVLALESEPWRANTASPLI